MNDSEEEEELLKRMNFIYPSCGIAYGINALVNDGTKVTEQYKCGSYDIFLLVI
jgi:hypothetical protein